MTDIHIDADFHEDLVAAGVFLAPNAVIRGNVRIDADASVWFGAVIRGDTERVEIGKRSNVQDLAVLHFDPGYPCLVGADVTIGHAAVVHGSTIGDGSLIGIRAVVLNGASVGAGAIIGAGAVVTEGSHIPPGSMAVGVPAKVKRELTADDIERIRHAAQHYVTASRAYQS